MWCPFMTIALSVAADQVVSHGACMGADCALWNAHSGMCAFTAASDAITSLLAASLVAAGIPPLKDDKPPS